MKFDFKKAFVDHVEKLVFGVILVFAIAGLAKTDWSPYEGTPEEITTKVSENEAKLLSDTWPAEERDAYVLTPEKRPENVVDSELYQSLDIAKYEFSTKFTRILGSDKDPLSEPVLHAPQEPIASSGRVFIELPMEEEEEGTEGEEGKEGNEDKEKMKEEDEDIPDEFRQAVGGQAGGGAQGGLGGAYGGDMAPELSMGGAYGMAPAGYDGAGGESQDMSAMMGEAYGMGGAYGGDEYGMMGGMGMGMAAGPKKNGQGHHYVSVRAVFPLKDQLVKYAEATHTSIFAAQRNFEIYDFELERQVKQGGNDPWSGPWERVDIKVAEDVLNKANGFSVDVVNSLITNSVITMPLPMRITGAWKTDATHPRISKYELSEEQLQLEMQLNFVLLKQFVDDKKTEQEGKVKKGGFAQNQYDAASMQSAVMGGGMGAGMTGGFGGMPGGTGMGGGSRGTPKAKKDDPEEKFFEVVRKSLRGDEAAKKEQEEALRVYLRNRAKAEGDLLLFRYIDFQVDPGKTYRYRVRFVVNNPNFGRRISEAGGLAHVVTGETRMTDWSEVTAPVKVEQPMNYFLKNVLSARSARVYGEAVVDAIQWDAKFGTFMNSTLRIMPGQRLGGGAKTAVYKPAESDFADEQYVFKSPDILVDSYGDIEFDPEFHSSDKVDPATRLATRKLQFTGYALVDQGDDGLALYDGNSREKEHAGWKKNLEYQAEQFKKFKEAKENAELMKSGAGGGYGGGGDEYGGMMGGGMMGGGMMGGGMMGGPQKRNALRKGGGK